MDAGPSTAAGRGEKGRPRPGPWPPRIEPFVPNTEHNPRELKSWARRTGFKSNVSGESTASTATGEWGPLDLKDGPAGGLDLEKGRSERPEIEPILGRRLAGARARARAGADGIEIGQAPRAEPDIEKLRSKDGEIKRNEGEKRGIGAEPPTALGLKDEGKIGGSGLPPLGPKNNGLNGNGNGGSAVSPPSAREEEAKKTMGKDEGQVGIDVFPDPMEQEISPPGFMGGIMENLGYGGYTLP